MHMSLTLLLEGALRNFILEPQKDWHSLSATGSGSEQPPLGRANGTHYHQLNGHFAWAKASIISSTGMRLHVSTSVPKLFAYCGTAERMSCLQSE